MLKITEMSVEALSAAIKTRELSPSEITSAYLNRIKEHDGEIDAYLKICENEAMSVSSVCDTSLSAIAGIPAAIKDNICTKGIPTTCASKMLEKYIPPYSATVIEKLSEAGAVILGKLNMDEFAMGSSTENSAFKITHNPHDLNRVPGGSSGGSAAAVASFEAPYALGSDTGGSIRQPAAFCGVVGLKPTYGSVSRYGLIAFASSLDQIGPLTRTVRDNALVYDSICGYDKRDATSVKRDYVKVYEKLEGGVSGMRIALPRELFGEGISPDVKRQVLAAAKTFESMGAIVDETSLPSLKHALPAYYVISSAEASSNLARFDGVRYGYRAQSYTDIDELYKNSRSEAFGAEVKRRIMLGTFALSSGYYDAYYKKALQVRALIMADFNTAYKKYDLILSPVAPTTAFEIGEKSSNPLEMYMGDICTVPVNIAGIPALSLPCGKGDNGMPVGMQLIGPAFSEPVIYRAAAAFESEVHI